MGICFTGIYIPKYKHTAWSGLYRAAERQYLTYIYYEKETNRIIFELANFFGKHADVGKRCE